MAMASSTLESAVVDSNEIEDDFDNLGALSPDGKSLPFMRSDPAGSLAKLVYRMQYDVTNTPENESAALWGKEGRSL